MKKLLLSLSLLLVCVAGNAQKNPVLTIEGGQVQGVLADDHPEVFVYRGIPYAAPPIRENRWKAPQPVVPWKGVKICDTFGRPSYQAIQYTGGYYTEWGYGKDPVMSGKNSQSPCGFMVVATAKGLVPSQSSTDRNGGLKTWCL